MTPKPRTPIKMSDPHPLTKATTHVCSIPIQESRVYCMWYFLGLRSPPPSPIIKTTFLPALKYMRGCICIRTWIVDTLRYAVNYIYTDGIYSMNSSLEKIFNRMETTPLHALPLLTIYIISYTRAFPGNLIFLHFILIVTHLYVAFGLLKSQTSAFI